MTFPVKGQRRTGQVFHGGWPGRITRQQHANPSSTMPGPGRQGILLPPAAPIAGQGFFQARMPPRQTGKGFPRSMPSRRQGDKRPVQGLQTNRTDARATRPEQPPKATLPGPRAMVLCRYGRLYSTRKTRKSRPSWRGSQPGSPRQTRSRNSPAARVKPRDRPLQSTSISVHIYYSISPGPACNRATALSRSSG